MKVVCKKCNNLTDLASSQTCLNCGQVIKQPTTPSKLEAALGFLILIGLFGGCVYQIGYPYTCEQAKQNLGQAQRTAAERTSPETSIDAWSAGLAKEREAQAKANELCLK